MKDRGALAAALGVQAAGVVVFALTAARTLQFPYPLEYGEGHILDHVARLAAGDQLYRASLANPPYMVFNYTPLYLLVQWPFYAAFGPALWYGRLISQTSALMAGVCVGLTVHRLTADRLAAALAAAALPTATLIAYWSQLNRVDTLALALCWAGLAVVLRSRTPRGVIAGSLLLTAAVFTRQTFLIAGPSAAIAWLVANGRRRDAALFLTAFAALIVTLATIFQVWTDGGFWFNTVLANINEYQPRKLVRIALVLPLVAPGLLAAAAALVFARGPAFAFAATYLIAAGVGALTAGNVGSGPNHFFEPLAGCCLALGVVVSGGSATPRLVRLAVLVLLSTHLMLTIRGLSYSNDLDDRMAYRAEQDRLLALISSAGPPILTDDGSALLRIAGQPLVIDPFQMKQLELAGLWSPAALVKDIALARFRLILVTDTERDDGSVVRQKWSAEVLQAIREHYERRERIPIKTGTVTSVYHPR